MKKVVIAAIMVSVSAFSFDIQAVIHTVSNDSNFPADYSTLQNAIDGASSSDTIYVYGTSSSYGDISVDKTLVFIGVGHYPQIQTVSPSTIGTITLTAAASNTIFSGLYLSGDSNVEPASGTNSIIFENCFIRLTGSQYVIAGATNCDNWIIRGSRIWCSQNFISSGYYDVGFYVGSTNDNWLILNNVFHGNNIQLIEANQTTVFSHNLVLFYQIRFFQNCSEVIITNNMFIDYYSNSPMINFNDGCTNCLFNHNLTWSNYADENSLALPEIPNANNTGSNNLNNTNPFFTTYQGGSSFSYNHDYHLQAGSPAALAGSDGTDIGIYGGTGSFKFNMFGYPEIPRFYYMNIKNTVLPENGTLNIEIKGTTTR
ncbi:MAG TPA: hypothetical protein ENI20_19520 [Bacteroides sp.]|nr:hypothetical protein [Bacteroides sp.]